MTALRWPERELVDVPAEKVWYEPVKPLTTEAPGGREGRPLDLADVQGRRVVETRHLARIGVREENAAAALEVMSRFAVDPRLLAYLPPTMAPTATSRQEGYPGAPGRGVRAVPRGRRRARSCARRSTWGRGRWRWCAGTPTRRASGSASTARPGALHTRTGRPFFDDATVTEEILGRLRTAVTEAGLWDELDTGLAAAGRRADALVAEGVRAAAHPVRGGRCRVGRGLPAVPPPPWRRLSRGASRSDGLLAAQRERAVDAAAFTEAYRRYCWTTEGLEGVRLAPFQILAVQGRSSRASRTTSSWPGWTGWWSTTPPACSRSPAGSSSRPADEASVAGRRRLVAGDDGQGRRGHGRQAAPGAGPRRQGPAGPAGHQGPRAASTCGSSTARSTPARRTWSACAAGS